MEGDCWGIMLTASFIISVYFTNSEYSRKYLLTKSSGSLLGFVKSQKTVTTNVDHIIKVITRGNIT